MSRLKYIHSGLLGEIYWFRAVGGSVAKPFFAGRLYEQTGFIVRFPGFALLKAMRGKVRVAVMDMLRMQPAGLNEVR